MAARKKVLVIFGTRPEAVKMAPVVLELKKSQLIETIVCVTAQHREMLDQVLDVFAIVPDYDLNLMKPNQTLNSLSADVLTGLAGVMDQVRPDCVLVHGDTTTSSMAALAAYYGKFKVGHVEAGLRSGDKYAPWPEEMNRRITGCIADYHFAPTEGAARSLKMEGVAESAISVTGNTVVDALLQVREKLEGDVALKAELQAKLPFLRGGLRTVLVTAHRRESFGAGFERICSALIRIMEEVPDVQVVFPVHPNPNVLEPVQRILGCHGLREEGRVHLIEPLGYFPFVHLMSSCDLIISDSGGVQEEAPTFGIPVLVLRDTTERPEGVEAGVCKLVGTSERRIVEEALSALKGQSTLKAANPFGDGQASLRIREFLERLNG